MDMHELTPDFQATDVTMVTLTYINNRLLLLCSIQIDKNRNEKS